MIFFVYCKIFYNLGMIKDLFLEVIRDLLLFD